MKKLFLSLLIGLNSFSGYSLINYKGRNYLGKDEGSGLYYIIRVNKYRNSLINKYTEKYRIVRGLSNEEIDVFNCSPVYSKCK
jgi:hypothetical protein